MFNCVKVMFFRILWLKNVFAHRISAKNLYLNSVQIYTEMEYGTLILKSKISAEQVLSNNNKENCVKLLKSMKHIGIKKKNSIKKAAVLIILCTIKKQLSFLYTVRAHNLKSNGGQVAFPGGMQDEQDLNLEETALRETFEEIGIPRSEINIWGQGPEIYRSDVVVTPILGYVDNLSLNSLKRNSSEVATIFSATLNHLTSPQNFRTTQFRFNNSHVYKTPVYIGQFQRIWGLTAVITHLTLSALIPQIYNTNIKCDLTLQRILKIKNTA